MLFRSEKHVRYVDCGTSGGVWGIDRGYCLMIGGAKEAFQRLEAIFKRQARMPEEDIVSAMQKYRELTDRGRVALMAGDWDALGKVMNGPSVADLAPIDGNDT